MCAEAVVYLEAACGHEFRCDLSYGPAPESIECPEHGKRVALWAQRNEPKYDRTPMEVPRG